jgi:hypothetical protein
MITFIVYIIVASAACYRYSGMNHIRRMMIHPTARYKTVIVKRDNNFHHHGSMDFDVSTPKYTVLVAAIEWYVYITLATMVYTQKTKPG